MHTTDSPEAETPIDDFSPIHSSKAIRIKLLMDICCQSLGFALTLLFLVLEDYETAAKVFFIGVGSYQFLSSMIHLIFGKPLASYKIYYIQLGIYAFLFLFMFMGGGYLVGFFLFFATPCTAIYYLVITIQAYALARQLARERNT